MIQLYWIFCVGFSIFVLSQEIYIYLIDNVHLIKWGCWLEYNFIKREFHISSVAQLYLTLCNPMDCSMQGFPVHYQLLELTQTHVHRVSDAIQPSHLLSSPSPPPFSLSQHQGLFQWVSSSHQVAKVLEFQLQHQPSNEYSRLIFKIDWLDILAVKGTFKSLLQHHSSKASHSIPDYWKNHSFD